MSRVYYNEIDAYCAAWLRNLMSAGHIPAGDIDTRSIEDVRPDELRGYEQLHFFAGIGGWAYALQLAGWGDRPVWTGSCPCQPFSAAGKGAGFADERHLWPAWQHLIAQCRPAVVFGEQVASKDAEPWIDLVHADMEGMDYTFVCVPFPAAGIGAPHIRDRNYWVADACGSGWQGYQPLERFPIATSSAYAKYCDPFAISRRALVRDYTGLCIDDGISVAVERAATKAYGNAIVPQVAAEFVAAYLEARDVESRNSPNNGGVSIRRPSASCCKVAA